MPSFPWIQWHASKWLSSPTRLRMRLSERAIYLELLFVLYECNGFLPNDPVELARLAQATPEEFGEFWPVVSKNFVLCPDDDRKLTNIVALDVMQQQEANSRAGKHGGIKSGITRGNRSGPSKRGLEAEVGS
jgi:uncharacterized protein YdaU (DUF1376 family)